MKTQHEILMEDPEYRRLYAIEGPVADAAEELAGLMKSQGMSRADLARRLGKSRAWVTHLLSGRANTTLRTLAEVMYALGARVSLSAHPLDEEAAHAAWSELPSADYKFTTGAGRRSNAIVVRGVFAPDAESWEAWVRRCLKAPAREFFPRVHPGHVSTEPVSRLEYAA
jgi:transcriptional regulator with XRE-family HTH domain